MKRQGGFTLIEMIVVIVILGILAVTAAPKFLNLESEARAGVLKGVDTAIKSAVSISGATLALDPATDKFTHANGYPTADESGIGSLVDVSSELTGKVIAEVGFVWEYKENCYTGYAAPAAADGEPTYPTLTTGC